jgi:hypothetical protein
MHYTRHNSVVSMNGSMTKGSFGTTQKIHILIVEAKIAAFQSTISGHLFSLKKLEMKTYKIDGSCFYG